MPTFQYEDVAQKTLSPATRKAIAEQISKDVDAYCVKEFTDEHRHHLGASIIGKGCKRDIWYSWRWVRTAQFEGRMLRLFNRGHLEERRFVQWLRGIGCEVWEVDPETNKQFRIWAISGHYGGSADSGGFLPYLPDLPILFEYKTHKEKYFNEVKKKGVQLAQPSHYSQMCSYGKHYGFRYGLYCAVNKNDDDLHFELVELNWNQADQLVLKAAEIIHAKKPPEKISLNPSYYKCKMCVHEGICHRDEPAEINCRSCKFADPVENAEWYCNYWQQIIPKDFLIKGCGSHVSITIE